jgi:hypothetical protein
MTARKRRGGSGGRGGMKAARHEQPKPAPALSPEALERVLTATDSLAVPALHDGVWALIQRLLNEDRPRAEKLWR